MKTALALDIDSTLTPPRQPITAQMVDILMRLNVPFYVAAGSHFSLLQGQFFNPLYVHRFRGQFDAFVSNGAVHYHCDYSKEMSIKLVSEFNIRNYLGENDYLRLMDILAETLKMQQFQLPADLMIVDNRIVDRVSMINLCPIGRLEHEDPDAVRNREQFVSFDQSSGYREKIMEYLNLSLSSLIKEKHLHITLGGQTSFDIGISGEDKTKPVRKLLEEGFDKVVFIGDALFKGGNDAAVNELIDTWPSGPECPVEAIQTGSWLETIEIFKKKGFLD
ncbi:MAG: hypothetical protein Q7U10_05650 [Thermodesulfovibrionia bacterium]|nr:hypothetical protein [Thermodesulfovibrionia bacterium]